METQQFLSAGAFKAVSWMHKATGKAHLDIKADNIMFDDHLRPMIIDMGSANDLSTKTQRWSTTINYAPPEVLPYFGNSTREHLIAPYKNEPVDVFNMALLWYVITNQCFPFELTSKQTYWR